MIQEVVLCSIVSLFVPNCVKFLGHHLIDLHSSLKFMIWLNTRYHSSESVGQVKMLLSFVVLLLLTIEGRVKKLSENIFFSAALTLSHYHLYYHFYIFDFSNPMFMLSWEKTLQLQWRHRRKLSILMGITLCKSESKYRT